MYCLECDILGGEIISASQYASADAKPSQIASARERLLKHRLSAHGHDSLCCLEGEKVRFEHTVALSICMGFVNSGVEGDDRNTAFNKLWKAEEGMADHYKRCKCPESSPFFSPAVMDI